jgi:hypothetical protein
MRRRGIAVGIMLLLAVAMPLMAEPHLGNLDILPNVHGYMTGSAVLVPFRGLADWLGATIEFNQPVITLRDGDLTVKLTLGSETAQVNGRAVTLQVAPKAYGGITCVPLRFVAETFGVKATYHPLVMDMASPLAGLPFVELEREGNRAVVLVHSEPPDVVAAIIADLQPGTDGPYGERWIINIVKVGQDTVKVTGPVWYMESEANFTPAQMSDCDLIRVDGHWRFQPVTGGGEG